MDSFVCPNEKLIIRFPLKINLLYKHSGSYGENRIQCTLLLSLPHTVRLTSLVLYFSLCVFSESPLNMDTQTIQTLWCVPSVSLLTTFHCTRTLQLNEYFQNGHNMTAQCFHKFNQWPLHTVEFSGAQWLKNSVTKFNSHLAPHITLLYLSYFFRLHYAVTAANAENHRLCQF